jgi:hypothetical protein
VVGASHPTAAARALCHRIVNVLRPVIAGPAARHEQRPGRDLSRIINDIADHRVDRPGEQLHRLAGDQVIEFHHGIAVFAHSDGYYRRSGRRPTNHKIAAPTSPVTAQVHPRDGAIRSLTTRPPRQYDERLVPAEQPEPQ